MKKIYQYFTYFLVLIALLAFPFALNNCINVSAFSEFVVFIDPGHGGKDNGANYLNIYEDEINLAIASKLYEICLEKNLVAYISRTADYDLASLYAKNRKQEDLRKRAENIEHSGCNVFISIHMNSYSSNTVCGPMVYYEKNNDNSYNLAKSLQIELNLLAGTDKKVHYDDFYLFRKCSATGVLVECGFISNDQERIKLLNESYQQSIADAIYQGVYQYYLNYN